MRSGDYFVGSVPASYNNTVSFCILALRICFGTIIFVSGAMKVFGWFGGFGMETTIKYFAQGHISPTLAYLCMFTELIGGVLLVAGLLTRLAAMALFINMFMAVWTMGFEKFFIGGAAYPFTLAIIAMVIAITGAGKFSLDYLLNGREWR
jgi:putative oxidoreductase